MNTYISLFSSAGIGCYGFKLEDFECIATNEIIERRLDIQKSNKKCRYETGYICGDITEESTKDRLYSEINYWKKKEKVDRVDVVIATPPCQGMSVANHKKNEKEIVRNSLVVESIKIINTVHPRFFVLENVPSFMKTICTDIDGKDKPIAEAINDNLGTQYSYVSRVINFKNYGACSSRSRTLVIGVANDYADEISPFELYPDMKKERTLREVIGDMKPLERFGEIDENDIYHSFRIYPEHMRAWISDINEGESAFDNTQNEKKPHRVINGELVINQQKNGDKYRRQYWDKVGPCVHTRNDQLASQNTIHPRDDRVFSIRELMKMMTVPDSFVWSNEDICDLNNKSDKEKRAYLKKEEMKIRQSLGEAVPTVIFQGIAHKINIALKKKPATDTEIKRIVEEYELTNTDKAIAFINDNPLDLSYSTLCRIAEFANTSRTDHAAYYTNKSLITEMLKELSDSDSNAIRILEPSAGVGNFIPLIARRFEGKKITIDLMDIDENSRRLGLALLKKIKMPKQCHVNYIVDDFLLHSFDGKYDYIIGNPPFYKMSGNNSLLKTYRTNAINKDTTNICSFFLDKAMGMGEKVSLVLPKFVLNTPEFKATRQYLSQKAIEYILDFGEKGFKGVLIETIGLFIDNTKRVGKTKVISHMRNLRLLQRQNYICDKGFPYWVIYRNKAFDCVCAKMDFNMFDVFRDRQITNAILKQSGDIRVIKSRNVSDNGQKINSIDGYDAYIDIDEASKLAVYKFLNQENLYLTPNMTYNPRVMKKPKGVLVNGSVAILIPKKQVALSKKQLLFFSGEEYRKFYQIARNFQTRSLNVDSCSVFFFGILKEDKA